MDSFLTPAIATGVGILGTLLVQYITRGLGRRDQMLALRKKWASDVLDRMGEAWSERPFDSSKVETFLAPSPPRELDFVDPTANRIHTWLSFRLHITHAELRRQQETKSAHLASPYLVYDEQMSKTRPLLIGWALGKRGYGPRAVERWLWASSDELDVSDGRTPDSKEMRPLARKYMKATRVRP